MKIFLIFKKIFESKKKNIDIYIIYFKDYYFKQGENFIKNISNNNISLNYNLLLT